MCFHEDQKHDEAAADIYATRHAKMTMEHVTNMHKKWMSMDHGAYSIEQVVRLLDTIVDASSAGMGVGNLMHSFQTAERLRDCFPHLDWLHLVGLLHDLGKVMCCWGEPQWNVVGDTYPVGCKFSRKITMSPNFVANPDTAHGIYNTELGIYFAQCGLDKLMMSWGQDEYMYRVLVHNKCTIPAHGLGIIRYRSFNAWHIGNEYTHFTKVNDRATQLAWVRTFNEHNLDTENRSLLTIDRRWELWNSYYKHLCAKYNIGEYLMW